MLTAEQAALWAAYLHAEARAPRDQKLAALGTFLDALTTPSADWHPWARDLARRVIDERADLVIRTPLFALAVFPALLAGHRAGLPGCARWLAGLAQHLYRSPSSRVQLPEDEQTELGLLRAAVRVDPHDHDSRRRLVEHLAGRLRYSLHELPSGVLYGMDGATPEECRELLEGELDEFEALLAGGGPGPDYRGLVTDCRFHFRAYRAFLLNRERYRTYREYLTGHPPVHDQRP
ncbi:MAG TPA: hypothetical protein VD866_30255 [Urbifossiella sp.]|nr:hypothetical protein [Urbifossiella sp.]